MWPVPRAVDHRGRLGRKRCDLLDAVASKRRSRPKSPLGWFAQRPLPKWDSVDQRTLFGRALERGGSFVATIERQRSSTGPPVRGASTECAGAGCLQQIPVSSRRGGSPRGIRAGGGETSSGRRARFTPEFRGAVLSGIPPASLGSEPAWKIKGSAWFEGLRAVHPRRTRASRLFCGLSVTG